MKIMRVCEKKRINCRYVCVSWFSYGCYLDCMLFFWFSWDPGAELANDTVKYIHEAQQRVRRFDPCAPSRPPQPTYPDQRYTFFSRVYSLQDVVPMLFNKKKFHGSVCVEGEGDERGV